MALIDMVHTQNGVIAVDSDAYGRSKEFSAYILNPARKPICRIGGITQFDIDLKFNDISEISFEVRRYVTDASTYEQVENPAYIYIHSFCEIYVPELGQKGFFIINEEPTIEATSTVDEFKTFVAQSYESVLQYENLVLFDINQGTVTSQEYNTGEKIRLYYPEKETHSLLHLALKDDYYGWRIGEVDPAIANLERSFSVDNQNVYAFFGSEVSTAFRCVFDYDTDHKLINVYSLETVGKNSNVYMSFSHMVHDLNIAPAVTDIYTVFNVEGADGLNINDINFGSSKIYNIDYPLSQVDEDLAERYRRFEKYRDDLRKQYAKISIDYADLMARKAAIEDRQPDSLLDNNWASPSYSLDELKLALENCKIIVEEIEREYTMPDGTIDYDDLDQHAEASQYYSYKNVAIPDLTSEITKRKASDVHAAKTVEQEFEFDLYGLNDLIAERQNLQNQIDVLIEGGYNTKKNTVSIDDVSYNEKYEMYVKYNEYIEKVDKMIKKKKAQVKELDKQMEALNDKRKYIAYLARLENHSFDQHLTTNTGSPIVTSDGQYLVSDLMSTEDLFFSREEIALIKTLYRESDYSDDNYLITELDDVASTINTQKELYEAAVKRLDIESHPQMSWTISSDDLFDMDEFRPLRDNLRIGDFIILDYGNVDYYSRRLNDDSHLIGEDGTPIIEEDGDDIASETEYEHAVKMRCVSFSFSGLKTFTDFSIMFSTMTNSKYQQNDYESILNDYITSKTNAISVRASSAAETAAGNIAASLIRPYIQILNAQIEKAEIQSASIQELEAVYGHFATLIVDYLKAEEADIKYATVDMMNVDLIQSRDGSSWWNLETGEMNLAGYTITVVTEYAVNTSPTTPPPDSAFAESDPPNTPPTPATGEYVWQRMVLVSGGTERHLSTPVCIQGVPGEKGESVVAVSGLSSEGLVLKNNKKSTTITITVQKGTTLITDMTTLRQEFGNDVKIFWYIKQMGDTAYTIIPENDSRIKNDGFALTVLASDIKKQVDVKYEVWI